MGFMESYKHLEKLCGELLNDDRPVTAYIDEMESKYNASALVSGWDNDLKQLKHYRWIRNQIVHDPSCCEENMCEPDDALWLDNFYSRIMNQTDPLALYAKKTKPRTAPKPQGKAALSSQYPAKYPTQYPTQYPDQYPDQHPTQYPTYHQPSNEYKKTSEKPTDKDIDWVTLIIVGLLISMIVILICHKVFEIIPV